MKQLYLDFYNRYRHVLFVLFMITGLILDCNQHHWLNHLIIMIACLIALPNEFITKDEFGMLMNPFLIISSTIAMFL